MTLQYQCDKCNSLHKERRLTPGKEGVYNISLSLGLYTKHFDLCNKCLKTSPWIAKELLVKPQEATSEQLIELLGILIEEMIDDRINN